MQVTGHRKGPRVRGAGHPIVADERVLGSGMKSDQGVLGPDRGPVDLILFLSHLSIKFIQSTRESMQ